MKITIKASTSGDEDYESMDHDELESLDVYKRQVKDCGATPIIPTPSGTGGRSAAVSPETSW